MTLAEKLQSKDMQINSLLINFEKMSDKAHIYERALDIAIHEYIGTDKTGQYSSVLFEATKRAILTKARSEYEHQRF